MFFTYTLQSSSTNTWHILRKDFSSTCSIQLFLNDLSESRKFMGNIYSRHGSIAISFITHSFWRNGESNIPGLTSWIWLSSKILIQNNPCTVKLSAVEYYNFISYSQFREVHIRKRFRISNVTNEVAGQVTGCKWRGKQIFAQGGIVMVLLTVSEDHECGMHWIPND